MIFVGVSSFVTVMLDVVGLSDSGSLVIVSLVIMFLYIWCGLAVDVLTDFFK